MHDNQVGLKAAFPFGFKRTVVHVTLEGLIFAALEPGVVIEGRFVFVQFAAAVRANVSS